MADLAISGGYTVEDLDWLRDEIGVAHLELDPWGSLIVSPATDEHEIAAGALTRPSDLQLILTVIGNASFAGPSRAGPDTSWSRTSPSSRPIGGGWARSVFDPPPLLVVEIASPSTRRADRGRKLADYRLGGAGIYLLVDLPATFEAHDFADGQGRQGGR